MALLAGGLATRLGSLTARLPKSLVFVAGEPFIAHQLRLLARQEVCDIVICCGHFGEQIESFVGDGSRFGCRVRYSYDGPEPLGTGGAIFKALPLLGSRFWIMYGDSYLTTPFAPVLSTFEMSDLPALMTVFANDNRWDVSNVQLDAGRIIRYDKRTVHHDMHHIDYGLSLCGDELFREWSGNPIFDLSALQSQLAQRGLLAGYEVGECFFEIGSFSGLKRADAFLTRHFAKGDCAEADGKSRGICEVQV